MSNSVKLNKLESLGVPKEEALGIIETERKAKLTEHYKQIGFVDKNEAQGFYNSVSNVLKNPSSQESQEFLKSIESNDDFRKKYAEVLPLLAFHMHERIEEKMDNLEDASQYKRAVWHNFAKVIVALKPEEVIQVMHLVKDFDSGEHITEDFGQRAVPLTIQALASFKDEKFVSLIDGIREVQEAKRTPTDHEQLGFS